MQQEAFRIQKDMYNIIQDALLLDLDEYEIKKILRDAQMPNSKIRKLLNGEFVPANYSEARFKKKVKILEKQASQMTKDDKDLKFYLDEDYAYPRDLLKDIKYEWKNRSLITEPKEEKPGLIKKGIKKVWSHVNPLKGFQDFGSVMSIGDQSKIQTPPLQQTPTPVVNQAQMTQKDPQTNLTRTETALLSPTEKVIAGRT